MGRRKTYHTDEERKQAHRLANQRYREKKRTDTEFERLANISPDLYSSPDHFFRSLMNLPLSKEPLSQNSIFNVQPQLYSSRKRTRFVNSDKKQIGIAQHLLKSNSPFITFDLTKVQDKKQLTEDIKSFLLEFLDSIAVDEDKWIVYYDYGSGWKGKTITSISEKMLKDQIKKEVDEAQYDFQISEHDYDFFPVLIRSIKKLTLINYSSIGDQKIVNELLNSGASTKTIKNFRKKREGRFWKWTLDYREIDLSKFMIFNNLGKEQAQLINKQNCFVYACIQSGLSESIIDDLIHSVKKRSIAMADIPKIANSCGLKFRIKFEDGSHKVIGSGTNTVKLLLMKNHYMLDERVKVSPYYIKHRDEIIKSCPYMKDKQTICKKCGGKYKKGYDFSLRKVLLALFEVNAFTPISTGDYMTFNSLACFEKLAPLKNLEYDPKFCCRLKAPPKPFINEFTYDYSKEDIEQFKNEFNLQKN